MDKPGPGGLVALFIERYQDFRAQLRRRLGSDDLAQDAMQETYMRIQGMEGPATIRQPADYLFRVAVNIAEDQRRRDARLLSGTEIAELIQPADDSLNPARISEGRSEIEALRRALQDLPVRAQQMLWASRVEDVPHVEIARRYGVSERLVSREIQRALAYCVAHMDSDGDADSAAADMPAWRGRARRRQERSS